MFQADYILRIRHRDQSSDPATEYSAWATRSFRTGSAGQVFPILLTDIAGSPAPVWTGTNGEDVILSPAAAQPTLARTYCVLSISERRSSQRMSPTAIRP